MPRFREDLRLAVDVLATPTDVFGILATRPRWGTVYALYGALALLNAFLMHPFLDRLTCLTLTGTLPPDQIDAAMAVSRRLKITQLPLPAILLPVRWLLYSLLLVSAIAVSGGARPSFARLFAVVAYSHAVLVVEDLVNLLLLYWNGPGALHAATDLDAIGGLALFLHDRAAQPALAAFLGNLNPFTLWHTITVGIGISVISGNSRTRSFLTVSSIWVLMGILVAWAARLATP